MSSDLNIVILAAGKGTRMYSDIPKVLHKLAGKSLLCHVTDTAAKLDPLQSIIVYGYGGELVRDSIQDTNIDWIEQKEQLGTGHALQQASALLGSGSVTLVLYGDVPLIAVSTLRKLVSLAQGDCLAILTIILDNPNGYGRIVRDANGSVLKVVEHKDASDAQLGIREINTGILALPTDKLHGWLKRLNNENSQREYYLTDVIEMAVADQIRIKTCFPENEWEIHGVNNKSQLAQLERSYQRNSAEVLMSQGVHILDPERIDIRGELICGRDVSIDINCLIEGKVTLEDNVIVGAHSVIRNSIIKANTTIEPFSLIDQAEIGSGGKIGPYARIRPGSVLQNDVHIGNFVEIKNSSIDEGAKINHLSYIGDATVGKKVNIGAGTITCNYDGANKHRTVIEDGAFIGSSTQLVAPVTVARNATIGAGSTITKDAPGNELTLSRAKQITIMGWKRPAKKVN